MNALRRLWRVLVAAAERWPADRVILIGDTLLIVPEKPEA